MTGPTRTSPPWSRLSWPSLNGVCGGPDHVDHEGGLREHGHVAAVGLMDAGAHPLRDEALQLGMNGVVVLAHGEMLLVHGGAGVVGSVAVQLARLRGARVIATGSAANQALLAALGATPVVYGDGLVARVRALGAPVDAVFDAAGKGALPDSIELRGGKTRIVTIADPSAHQLGIPFSAGTAAMRNVAVLRTMAELAASGKVTVAVAEVLPLAEAPRAHALIEKSHAPGKIVLTV